MAKRLGYAFLLTALTGSVLLAACGDDDPGAGGGGNAGEAASGGPSTGGSGGSGGSSGSAGKASAGAAGAEGGQPVALGGAAGNGGEGGEVPVDGGAAGAGGSPDSPDVVYACGTSTIVHKLCSAQLSLSCADQADCADCVAERTDERGTFAECPACLAAFDVGYQCGIDAFESGHATDALECVPEYGADLTFDCYQRQEPAYQCLDWLVEHPCPEEWPMLGAAGAGNE